MNIMEKHNKLNVQNIFYLLFKILLPIVLHDVSIEFMIGENVVNLK